MVRVENGAILNFRKLRQDFPSNILKEGKECFERGLVVQAKILSLDSVTLKMSGQVKGNFENIYESFIEIDRTESELVDSDCDCPYAYDCAHLAALLFYLEEHFEEILVTFSKETDLEETDELDDEEKEQLKKTFEQAESKQIEKQDQAIQKEILEEYRFACRTLADSPFFQPKQTSIENSVQVSLIISLASQQIFDHHDSPEIQLALRLPHRSKPISVPHINQFLDAIRFNEPVFFGGRKYFFGYRSFEEESREIIAMLLNYARFREGDKERNQKVVQMDSETFGNLLSRSYDMALEKFSNSRSEEESLEKPMPCLFIDSLEKPLQFSNLPVTIHFELDYLQTPSKQLLFQPYFEVGGKRLEMNEGFVFQSAKPGVIYEGVYYRFPPQIRRGHIKSLPQMRQMTVPQPLFGSFIEHALPELQRFGDVSNEEVLDHFVTYPYPEAVKARCQLEYLNGELEATLHFIYNDTELSAHDGDWTYEDVNAFIEEEGILARDLIGEKKLLEELFEDFVFNEKDGRYIAKTEKKIVEFMTGVVPRFQDRVAFDCPENLLEQFIYDETDFEILLEPSDQVGFYELNLKVNGHLEGTRLDQLWDCVSAKRSYIELERGKRKKGRKASSVKTPQTRLPKILVMDLKRIGPLVRVFDEIGIEVLDSQKELRPYWSLASMQPENFEGLPVKLKISDAIKELQNQIFGGKQIETSPIPASVQADLRSYQKEGVAWVERLRSMHLSGILADDMGLGKTLQAITAITQAVEKYGKIAPSLVVCPTSLTYNWKEECHKFNPKLNVVVVDGSPPQRKKLIEGIKDNDVVITSYSLLQKDIEHYMERSFSYAILDEAQHIKNRMTLNARSVKEIKAQHRLVLTGTPVENSLEELWSIFDYLMPGLLSSYDRFVERFIRSSGHFGRDSLETLKKKVSPFILRRMKQDVLKDLPPVSEIVYHCELTPVQKELYLSYARSAREELTKLVEKEGFQKVQIHVLATLTRLKQICCHPAIFAKKDVNPGDSAKYAMFLEVLHGLIEGGHKTVIFSQYTRMLQIIRNELEKSGIAFSYLDGSTKNRLSIVKEFNQNDKIPVFLVSLKAGGSGLNLVGADTVIHYDMWWNPAVESQATDRVHRLGQTKPVSSYRIITSGTIEEKILHLHERKKGLVKQVINSDEDAIAKLTWEDVLELLQT